MTLPDDRIKHLELVQNVISRMANESGRMKRFGLLSVGILASVSKATNAPSLAAVGCALAFVFWLLDSRYLQQERWYRAHFDEVRKMNGPTDFNLTPSEEIRKTNDLGKAMLGWSTAPIYGMMVLVAFLITLATNATPV